MSDSSQDFVGTPTQPFGPGKRGMSPDGPIRPAGAPEVPRSDEEPVRFSPPRLHPLVGHVALAGRPHPEESSIPPATSEEIIGPGLKFDGGAEKLDWDLLPTHALEEVIRVMQFGEKKYGRNNWQRLDNFDRRYYNAAMRHLVKERKDGDIFDDESELLSLAHAACCVLFRLEKECAKYKGIGDLARFKDEA